MAAAMNGMALHGGIIPYSGTFLVFSDYCRPAIRLAALMGAARHPCDDARFDRARRRRPDAPAGRASRGAARDPEPAGVPALRRGRDGRVLAARAAKRRRARACSRSPGRTCRSCGSAHDDSNRCAAGAYEIVAGREQGRRGLAVRHRLGSRDRGRGAQAPARARRRRARRLGAVLRAVPRAAGSRARARSSATARSRSRSRPRCARAGTRSSAPTAPSSA